MITVLIVAPPRPDLAELEVRDPSIEILFARDAEETLEKLGRNRRIDAVLLLEKDPRATAEEILQDNPAAPPLYAPLPGAGVAGVRPLAPAPPWDLLSWIRRDLSAA
ncbi:MAG: hypothetical protein ABR576_02095 [Thermoanaerobaculia bacterium]